MDFHFSYKINGSDLLVIIDNIEYNVGEINTDDVNINTVDAYEFYKTLYPNYIGTRQQFKDDVINSRLFDGEALLTVIYNINGNQKEDYFSRGETLTFPNVSSKEYIIDWNSYKNTLLILTNGELFIEKIDKIEDKCSIFL